MKLKNLVGVAVALAFSSHALALEQGEHRFNGFGTIGFTHMGGEADGRSYGIQGQTNDKIRGDAVSKLAGQFQYGLTDDLSATVQVIAKADQDKWRANLEWLYAAYQVNDNLTLRAGRLRDPVYMFSETLDVGFTYPWLRLPDEVYSQVQITNYEGVDLVYTRSLGLGDLTFQLGGGQAKDRKFFLIDQKFDMDYDKVATVGVSLATPSYGTFRVGYTEADLTLEGIIDKKKGKFSSLGYQYDDGVWLATSELTNMVVEGASSTRDAFYVMGGRRFGDFLPHVTYAQYDEASQGRQTSMTYGLNYTLTPSITLKGEYKRVDTKDRSQGTFVKTAEDLTNEAVFGMTGGAMGSAPTGYDADIFSVGIDFVF